MCQFTSHKTTPMPVMKMKIACQTKYLTISPPKMGAMAGATPKKMVIWLITRWASASGNTSRTIARDTTVPAPVEKPCRARNAINCHTFCASAQPIDATMNTPSPHKITGRRPKLSDRAP